MAVQVALGTFDQIQIGMESAKGTLVAATRRLIGKGGIKEIQERYYPSYPRGVNTTVGGDGEILMKGTGFTIEQDFTPHDILWPLLTGLKGAVTGVGAVEKVWDFTAPSLTTVPALDSATIECNYNDGATNHLYMEAGYCMAKSMKIDWATNQVAKLSHEWFGRARQTGTPTAALVPYANRKILVSPAAKFYADTTYAGLGGTQLTGIVRSGSLTTNFFPDADFTLDGRADRDFVTHKMMPLTQTLDLVLEMDSVGAAEYSNWRGATRRFIRIDTDGPTIGGSVYRVRAEGSYRILAVETPEDGNTKLVGLKCEAVYDETAAKALGFQITNDLAAVA
jgi:hypothetical protein